jgi:hypothetical protein
MFYQSRMPASNPSERIGCITGGSQFCEMVNFDHDVGYRACQITPIIAQPLAFIGDENASCAPAFLRKGAAPCSKIVSNNLRQQEAERLRKEAH